MKLQDLKKLNGWEAYAKKAGVDPNIDFSQLPERFQKVMLAVFKIFVMYEVAQGDYKADYSDDNYKYTPWFLHDDEASAFRFGSSDYHCSAASSLGGARLALPERKTSDYMAEECIELFNEVNLKK